MKKPLLFLLLSLPLYTSAAFPPGPEVNQPPSNPGALDPSLDAIADTENQILTIPRVKVDGKHYLYDVKFKRTPVTMGYIGAYALTLQSYSTTPPQTNKDQPNCKTITDEQWNQTRYVLSSVELINKTLQCTGIIKAEFPNLIWYKWESESKQRMDLFADKATLKPTLTQYRLHNKKFSLYGAQNP